MELGREKAFTQKECIWQTPGQQDTSTAIMHLVLWAQTLSLRFTLSNLSSQPDEGEEAASWIKLYTEGI